ncbi:MAG: M14 family metallopeptidase [Thermoanaerobaculia bacterium]
MSEARCLAKTRWIAMTTLMGALLTGLAAGEEPTVFAVGPLKAARGEQMSGFLEVPAGSDEGTRIPITVVQGRSEGPLLALIAGTHGYEYPPILALQRVRRELDAAALSGTLILVHVANLPSFLGRTIYYSPIDGKNLNRVYPGDPEGTVSDRIADVLYKQVIELADYVVDMHGGDGNEALRPYLYLTVTGESALDERSKALGLAFGLDTIVVQGGWSDEPTAHVYTEWAALGLGKPAITTETGSMGSTDETLVSLAEQGVWNLLRHLGMLEGEPQRSPGVVWLEEGQVVRSPAAGMFQPAVKEGYFVEKDGLLGTLSDFFGDPIQPVTAPFAGVVNYVISTPPVSEREPLAMVSRVRGAD